MRRSLATLSLSLTLLAAFALPVSACLNDRDVNAKEREFKSLYRESQPGAALEPEYSPPLREKVIPFAAFGAGSFLLLGASVMCLRRK